MAIEHQKSGWVSNWISGLHFADLIAFLALSPLAHSAPPVPAQLASDLRDATVTSANGQTQFTTGTSRPFSLLIEVMRIQYGVVICYEDPPYLNSDDVITSSPKGLPPYRVPAGGKLSLTYSADNVAAVLEQLARVRLAPDRGAHFHVVQSGSVFMFLPLDVRDANGNRVTSRSPLDAHITLPAGSRPASETLGEVLKLTADASHQRIVNMTPPGPDFPGDPTYEMSATDETARSVLLRALSLMEAQKGPMAWDFFFDPDSGQYYMNFSAVNKRRSSTIIPASTNSKAIPTGGNAARSGITPH